MSKSDSELLLKKQKNYGSRISRRKGKRSIEPPENEENPKVYTLDEALDKCIGTFGHWQLRVSILCSLLKFPIAWFQLGIVFLAPSTQFWCRRPDKYSDMPINNWLEMIKINDSYHKNMHHHQQSLLNGSCYMRNPMDNTTVQDTYIVPCLWGYEFNTKYSSIITEWELVCGREKLIDLAQMILMFGVLLGTVSLGIASDRFGRKPVLVICLAVQSIAGSITSIAPNYLIFVIARFVTAFANAGTMVSSFVMCMEIVGGKWRTIIPILYQLPFGLGNTVMAIIAYFVREWRLFQFILSALSLLYLAYWYYLPESPRWLLATGRKERAIEILKEAARINKMPVSAISEILENIPSTDLQTDEKNKLNMCAVFRTPTIRKKCIFLCLHWFFAGVCFYGFGQYMGQVSTHLYITVIIGGLISLPGTIFCCFVTRKYGRKLTIGIAHIYTALCYFAIMLVGKGKYYGDWPRIFFAALGVIGLSISTPALYLFTGEIFPTVLRNAGVGATLTCSRIGSMIAPFVSALSSYALELPLLVLGFFALIEALLLLPLPETKDIALPDTITDVQHNEGFDLTAKKTSDYVIVPSSEAEDEKEEAGGVTTS